MDKSITSSIHRHERNVARQQKKLYRTNKESEVNFMLETLIKAVVVAVILVAIYYLVQWVVLALGLPAIIVTIVAILLVLAFVLWLIRSFGISF